MKNRLLILAAAFLALCACQKEISAEQEMPYPIANLQFAIDIQYPSDTKAVKTGWTPGDRVFIFFSGVTTDYVYLDFDGDAWSVPIQEGSASLSQSGTLTAIYLPFGNTAIPSYNSGWTFDGGMGSYYLLAEKIPYNIVDTGNSMATLTATLYMAMPDGYAQFFLPDASASGTVKIACNVAAPGGLAGIALDGTVSPVVGSTGAWMTAYGATIDGEKGYYAYGKPVSNPGRHCYFALEYGAGPYYKHYYKYRSREISARGAYQLPSASVWPEVVGTDGISYVEIAGNTWACVNVGASHPWETGTPQATRTDANSALPPGNVLPGYSAWADLRNTANSTLVSVSLLGVNGYLVIDKSATTRYLFLAQGSYWADTDGYFQIPESGNPAVYETGNPASAAYVRMFINAGNIFTGDFNNPVDGGDI